MNTELIRAENYRSTGLHLPDVARILESGKAPVADDLSGLLPTASSNAGRITEQITDMIEADRAREETELARVIYSLLGKSKDTIAKEVEAIRKLRADEARHMRNLKMLNHAIESAKTTMDYKSVLEVLNAITISSYADLGEDPTKFGVPPFPKKQSSVKSGDVKKAS